MDDFERTGSERNHYRRRPGAASSGRDPVPAVLIGSDQQAADLLSRVAQGDAEALRILVEKEAPFVYAVALGILREPRAAEAVTQDTFLTLWSDRAHTDLSGGSVRGFLMSAARRRALDAAPPDESRHQAPDLAMHAEAMITPPHDGVDEGNAVRQALRGLPAVAREALILAFCGGLTYPQIAVRLGSSEGAVKTSMRDGLTRLRSLLASPAHEQG